MTEEKAIAKVDPHPQLSADVAAFEFAQRQAKLWSSSTLVPEIYRGPAGIANCMIAMNLAKRLKVDPLTVMQSMAPIHGKPSWAANFVLALINNSGNYAPIRYKTTDLGKKTVDYTYWEGQGPNRKKQIGKIEINDKSVRIVTTDREGNDIEGPEVTIAMAVKDGWYMRPESKWQTMPELMLRYRAIAFFARTQAPELLVGLPVEGEVEDFGRTDEYKLSTPRPTLTPAPEVSAVLTTPIVTTVEEVNPDLFNEPSTPAMKPSDFK